MNDLTTLDHVVGAVMAIAILRGLWIGLIREGFSIAALGGGLIAVRYGIGPVSEIIETAGGGRIGETTSAWIAGVLIGIAVIAAIGTAGRLLRRGAQAVGLGFADRLGGGVVGAAEGTLACAVILLATIWVLGEDDPQITNSRSVELLEQLQTEMAESGAELPSVAAPADWLRKR